MARIRIYVPCAVVPVRVRLGFSSEGLSSLEAALLRVVLGLSLSDDAQGGVGKAGNAAAEPVPLRDLIGMLGIARTMTMHLIADLWRQGHLVLNFEHGLVTPDPDTVRAYRAGKLAGLTTGEIALDVVEVLQDYVTGQVIGATGFTSPPDRRLALPRNGLFVPSEDDIHPTALLDAVKRVLQETNTEPADESAAAVIGKGRRPEVREAHVDRSGTAATAVRWLPLEIAVRRDVDSLRLRVEVADRTLSRASRTRAGDRITQYLEESPDDAFVQHLQGRVAAALGAAQTPERVLEQLTRLLAGAATAPADTRQSHHARLRNLAEQVRRELEERWAHRMRVRVIGNGVAHRAAVLDLISTAEHQLVLAGPIVTAAGLQQLLGPLEERIRAGVQVVVLWGSRRELQLDDRVVRMLKSLREPAGARSGGGTVLWSARPARSAACLVIADGREALVGGFPPLSHERRRGGLALAVMAPDASACRPLEQLLAWVRRAMPDHAASRGILFRPSDFGYTESAAGDGKSGVGDAQSVAAVAALPIPPPAYPGEPPDHDLGDAATAVTAWVGAWTTIVDDLRMQTEDEKPGLPIVDVVEDAAHRDRFWDELRSARSRLVIGADDVAGYVVSDRLLEVLRRRLDAGVPLRVVHRRGMKDGHGRDGHALLRELQVGRPLGTCRIERAQTNGRALVSDTRVIVGSFDFLAHEGYFSSTGRRMDSEVGLALDDVGLADAVVDALGGVVVDGDPEPVAPTLPTLAESDYRDSGLALGLLTELASVPSDPDRRAGLIRLAVEDLGSDLLDALERAAASDDVLRVAAAWWLVGASAADSARPRWTAWLLREAWRRGDVGGCWVLRRSVDAAGWGPAVDAVPPGPRGDRAPVETVIRLAAALGGARVGDTVLEIVLGDRPPTPLLETSVLVAAAELTTGPDDTVRTRTLLDALVYLADVPEVAAPWRELAQVLADTRPAVFPFPHADLRDDRDLEQSRADLATGWAQLEAAMAAVSGTSFLFEAGIKTHAHLFHPAGRFGELATSISTQDLAAIRAWARSSDLRNISTLIDAVSDEVTQKHSRIEGRPRRGYVAKLSSVVTAARRLGRVPDPPADDDRVRDRALAARPVAAAMAKLWPAVPVAAAVLTSPEREVCECMLARLAPVVEWGRSRR